MSLAFTKMHGAGNDFVFLNALAEKLPDNLEEFSRRICHRQFGVGADQVLIVRPSKTHDFYMEIYNADGGRVEMCGNGIRCFVKYVRDKKLTDKTEIRVETLGGTIVPKLILDHPQTTAQTAWVRVDMGEPILDAKKVPTLGDGKLVNYKLDLVLGGRPGAIPNSVHLTAVSMGNPHAVIFVDDVKKYPVDVMGPLLENHPFFPNRTNVEFVEIKSRSHLVQRTWERGTGETFACGTGASAVCVAAILNNLADRSVKISLKGGDLDLAWDDKSNHVFKTGPATTVFEGVLA